MIRQGSKPGFRIGLDGPGYAAYRRVLPFRRSWKAILVLLALDAVFLFPAWAALHQAAAQWARFEDLFDLVMALFLSAWLLGWSIAPLLISAVLLALLVGREVIRANPRQLELFLGLPGIGLVGIYDSAIMRNLRLAQAPQKSGRSWREGHLCFDYGANTVEFGSGLSAEDAAEIRHGIEMATGSSIRSGVALASELEPPWESPAIKGGAPARADSQPSQSHARHRDWQSPSTLLLVAANLVPVAGAVFFGWKLADVMVLYWCESAIIGFFNLCKIVAAERWMAMFSGIFFVAHFGAFMAVHFLFIYLLFVQGGFVQGGNSSAAGGGDLGEVWAMFRSLWPALLALLVSHGYSFVSNFLGRQEYIDRSGKELMAEPYKRVVFMHLVLIFGGGLSLLLGDSRPVLLGVIAIKIWLDARAHMREHLPRDS